MTPITTLLDEIWNADDNWFLYRDGKDYVMERPAALYDEHEFVKITGENLTAVVLAVWKLHYAKEAA